MMKGKAVFLVCCLFFLCSGCQLQPEQNTDKQKTSTTIITEHIPKSYYKKTEKLTIDLSLDVPSNLQLYKTTAKKLKVSDYKDSIQNVLFFGNDWNYKEDINTCDEEGQICTTYEWRNTTSDVLGPFLSVSDRGFNFNNDPIPNDGEFSMTDLIQYSFRGNQFMQDGYYEKSAPYNANQYSTVKNLPFMPMQSAIKSVLNTLKQTELPIGNVCTECFALSSDKLQKEFVYIDQNGVKQDYNIQWKNIEDAYYMFIRQKLQDLPVFFYNGFFSTLPTDTIGRESSPIKIIYTDQGILSAYCEKLFVFQEDQNQTISLAPFEDIMNTVSTRYTEILTDSSYIINKGGLYYYAKGNNKDGYEMIPAWIFQVTENYTNESWMENTQYSLFIVNAQTGKEMEYE